MVQTKITLTEELTNFLSFHKELGFKNKSDMIREALTSLKQKLEEEKLAQSARIYSELYENDEEIKEWCEDAIKEWDNDV
jgi:Arc/MetJ-type ribon-helix-helix transcriptional regulator